MTRIIIPIEGRDNPVVAASFGRAAAFWVKDGDNPAEIVDNAAISDPGGAGIKAAQQVIDLQADALLTPHLGENAAKVLRGAGISLFRSLQGPASATADAHARAELDVLGDFHRGHHGASE